MRSKSPCRSHGKLGKLQPRPLQSEFLYMHTTADRIGWSDFFFCENSVRYVFRGLLGFQIHSKVCLRRVWSLCSFCGSSMSTLFQMLMIVNQHPVFAVLRMFPGCSSTSKLCGSFESARQHPALLHVFMYVT